MERALQEKNRPLHRENFWLFSFILVDGTYKCIHCQRKMKKKMFRKIIFKPSSEATRRGLWMALVVPSPNCPSSLSPQENTSPTTTKKKKISCQVWYFYSWQYRKSDPSLPVSVHATQWREPQATSMTFLFWRADTLRGLLTWSSDPCPKRW